jgi:hypothetical protein
MKAAKGTINEALNQVANYGRKELDEVKIGDICKCCDNKIDAKGKCGCDSDCEHCGGNHSLDERETDKYGNPKLSDADKDKIGRIREQISDKQEELDRLKNQIVSIKKAAGLPV